MKYTILLLAFLCCGSAKAQFYSGSEMDAVYIATLKAVMDYKIDDERNVKKLEKLRRDKKFNQKLEKMLSQLNNKKLKTGKNKRVYEILVQAGKKLYNELD